MARGKGDVSVREFLEERLPKVFASVRTAQATPQHQIKSSFLGFINTVLFLVHTACSSWVSLGSLLLTVTQGLRLTKAPPPGAWS